MAAADGKIDVVDAYARPIAAHTATALFGIRGSDERTFMDVARAIFGHVFLNLTDDEDIRQRALRAAALMEAWFKDEIKRRRASGDLGTDMMGALMAAQGGGRRRRAPHIGRHAGRQHRYDREFRRQDRRR